MAQHYGTSIIPARPAKPKDKAKAEAGVLMAQRWILATLRNRTFFSLEELNQAIREKLSILNNRKFQKLDTTRAELFKTIEKPALKPLPLNAYEFARWKKATVNIDYHIEYDRHCYSVPYQLVREQVELRMKRLLKNAKLKINACVEDIDYRSPRGLDRSVMMNLISCDWIRKHQNVLITGATGVGKTFIACALANKACREGFSALYVRAPRFYYDLAIAKADDSYPKLFSKLAKTQLLVLDDLGVSPMTDSERRNLLEVIEDRNGSGSTLVASQLPIKNGSRLSANPPSLMLSWTASCTTLIRLTSRANP